MLSENEQEILNRLFYPRLYLEIASINSSGNKIARQWDLWTEIFLLDIILIGIDRLL